MGKQRKSNKETTVSDVEKNEEQLPETTEQAGETLGPDDRDVGQEPGDAGVDGDSAGDDGEAAGDDDANFGEEPPASGSEDEAGVDGSGSDDGEQIVAGDTHQPEAPAEEPTAPAEPAVETVTSLADLAPAAKPAFVEPKSDQADAIVNYIREYVVKMDPSKYNDAKTGVPAQARLYRMIVALMKLEFTSFKAGMDQLLSLIHEYRAAAFNDIYSRRFFENLYPTLTHAQVREFDDLLSVLVTIGTSSNRSRAMSQIDLPAALKSVKDAKSHQNMSAYFSALR